MAYIEVINNTKTFPSGDSSTRCSVRLVMFETVVGE